jgi:host factor-I protein
MQGFVILPRLPDSEQCANSTSQGLVRVVVEIAPPPPYRKEAMIASAAMSTYRQISCGRFLQARNRKGPRIWGCAVFLHVCQGGTMENKAAQNIQDGFLNTARKDKFVVTIFLMSGVKLTGRIRSFDKYSVVLDRDNQEHLIFKHAISTVVMSRSSHPERHFEHRAIAGPSAPADTETANTTSEG